MRAARVLASSLFKEADADDSGTLDQQEVGSMIAIIESKFPQIQLDPPFLLERDFAEMTGQIWNPPADEGEQEHDGHGGHGGGGGGGAAGRGRKRRFVKAEVEVSWDQFEAWWRQRSGDDEGTVPVLPEALVMRVNDLARQMGTVLP